MVLERIAAERLTATGERRIRVEDPQAAANHDRQGDDVHPMGDPDYRVMTFHARPNTNPYNSITKTIVVMTT